MQRMFTLAGAALLALAVGCDDSILTPSETPSASKTAATSADSDWDKMAADLKKASAELEAEMAKLGAAMKEAPDWEQMEAEMKKAAEEMERSMKEFENLGNSSDFGF